VFPGFWPSPMLFITYTEGTTPVFDTDTVQYHLFATDAQSYDHCPVSAASSLVTRLSSCVTDLANSYASLRLQLNPSKTEFIWFRTRHNLAKLPTECCSLTVCLLSVILVSCWTVSYPCKATSARSPVHVSVICKGYVRSGIMSLKKSWHNSLHHSSFLALTSVAHRPSCIYPGASAMSTKCRCSTCDQP